MHELGTVIYVIETVEKLAEENALTKIGSVTLEVGEVSGIIPDYLADFWLYARKSHPILAEAELKIEALPGVTFCQDCKQTYSTVAHGKECPHCHSFNTFLVTGNEYNLKEIEAM